MISFIIEYYYERWAAVSEAVRIRDGGSCGDSVAGRLRISQFPMRMSA
jgi:hypothetical protein